ncbi:hypothetical protein SCALM49S_07157 [Streptomyces californicus]
MGTAVRGRRRAAGGPLPQRGGIDAVRVRLPEDPEGRWGSVGAYLVARFGGAIGADRVAGMVAAGRFVGADGVAVRGSEPYAAGRCLWFHRDFAPEEPVPFPVGVVYRDERIVVVDKPHFLATMPRGRHVTETAVARLRRELELPALQPAHRLDRLTAGLLLCVVRPGDRGAYQTLFRDRRVRKEYDAVAPYDPSVALPGPYAAGSSRSAGCSPPVRSRARPTARAGSSWWSGGAGPGATGCCPRPGGRISCGST